MQNKTILVVIILLLSFSGFAQQIPVGSCGIVNIYDAAGNRTKRTYFCNNGTNPYPQRGSIVKGDKDGEEQTEIKPEETTEFQQIDALYPNPTTSKFSVTFSKALNNTTIYVLDAAGKTIMTVKAKGFKADFDLAGKAAGVYYVHIEENGKIITKKVVKQ